MILPYMGDYYSWYSYITANDNIHIQHGYKNLYDDKLNEL